MELSRKNDRTKLNFSTFWNYAIRIFCARPQLPYNRTSPRIASLQFQCDHPGNFTAPNEDVIALALAFTEPCPVDIYQEVFVWDIGHTHRATFFVAFSCNTFRGNPGPNLVADACHRNLGSLPYQIGNLRPSVVNVHRHAVVPGWEVADLEIEGDFPDHGALGRLLGLEQPYP